MLSLVVQLVILPFRILAILLNMLSHTQSSRRRPAARRNLAGRTQYRYNPAPGWPPAPHPRWIPPVGWQPDASWPSAPHGWRIVVPVGRTQRDVGKGIGLGVAGLLCAFIVVIGSAVSGGGASPSAYTPPPIAAAPAEDSPTPEVATESPSPSVRATPTHKAKPKPRPAPTTHRPATRRPAPRKTTHAPAYPAGASAVCRDGSISFSAHRQGTCSHHGGVAKWL